MARSPSISLEEVEHAKRDLENTKQSVTPYKIRKALGDRGSYQKIERYLSVLQREDTTHPESLRDYMTTLLLPVATQLLSDLKTPFETEIEALRSQVKEFRSALRLTKRSLQKKNDAYESLKAEYAVLEREYLAEIASLTESLQNEKLKNANLAGEVEGYKQQLSDFREIQTNMIKQHKKDMEGIKRTHRAHVRDLRSQLKNTK